jgi:hypothetical protein
MITSVRGEEVTSTHHLHIGGYSTVTAAYKHDHGIDSKPFRVQRRQAEVPGLDSKPFLPQRSLHLLPFFCQSRRTQLVQAYLPYGDFKPYDLEC